MTKEQFNILSLHQATRAKVKWCQILTMDRREGQTTGNLFEPEFYTHTQQNIYTLCCPLHS